MKCLNWNYKGLGQALTVRTTKNLAQEHRVNLMFLIETKCAADKLDRLGKKIGFMHWTGVDAEGLEGGI